MDTRRRSGLIKPVSLQSLALVPLVVVKLVRRVAGAAKRQSRGKEKRDAPDPSDPFAQSDKPEKTQGDTHITDSPEATKREDGNVDAACCAEPSDNSLSPALPTELWAQVLKHATNTHPPPMSIHDVAHTGFVDSPRLTCLELQRRLHHLSMKTKTALTLVCKSWYPLAKPILFESVRITEYKQIESLLLLLESEQQEGKTGPASSAWWIRELWFDTTICTCSQPLAPNSLAKLLELCPRVLTFRKFGRSDCGARDIQEVNVVLKPLICPSKRPRKDERHNPGIMLTHLDLAFSNMWSFEHFLLAHPTLGNEIPSIRCMELRPSYISMFDYSESESHYLDTVRPTFPSLTSLRLLGSLSIIQATRFNLPALRSLTIYSTAFDRSGDYHSISTILRTHGSDLVELELDVPLSCLQDLHATCPNLQRLQIPAAAILDPEFPDISHPTVRTLGIFGMHKLVYEQKHRAFTPRLLEGLEKHFSGIAEVQDISLKSHDLRQRSVTLWTAQDALDHRLFWSELAFSLGTRGVKLTDWSGYPICGFEGRRDSMIMESEADVISEGLICCH